MKSNRINLLRSRLRLTKRGVNLANRHTRLLLQDDRSTTNPPKLSSTSNAKYPTLKPPPQKIYFQGTLIPQRPIPPSPEDCCMSNCRPCVHDIYLSTLTQYKQDISHIRNTLEQRRIPIHTWPDEIRPQRLSHISGDAKISLIRPLADLQEPIPSDKEPQFDSTEMRAIKAAQEAKAIMVKQARHSGTAGGTNMFLEAGRLVLWVLKGCPE